MKWTKYAVSFSSPKYGKMAFASVTGAFIRITPELEKLVGSMRGDVSPELFAGSPMAYFNLRKSGFIVADGDDDGIYNEKRRRNLALWQGGDTLSLTVAVTDGCNFRCKYCFEKHHPGNVMTEEVQDKLIGFIRRSGKRRLNLVWYGGEPLLALNVIRSLDGKIKAEKIPYTAAVITNGYLLEKNSAEMLNGLNISLVQITLDGDEKTHNARRPLAGGGETYNTVLRNIRALAASEYCGRIYVRVNVDGNNEDAFASVYNMLRREFPEIFGKKLVVYPGFVKGEGEMCFTGARQGTFAADIYEKCGIAPLSFYPRRKMQSCTMTNKNAFAVGPGGELYKCWDDVGDIGSAVGTVDAPADFTAENSYLDDEKCRDCAFFPICDGGCPAVRRRRGDTCTYFKDNLPVLLEHYYERRLKEKK